MKRCVVNVFSEGREDYASGTKRLIKSLQQVGYKDDIIVFSPEYTNDDIIKLDDITLYTYSGWGHNETYGKAFPHKEYNYQFKSYALQFAKEHGYDQVIWMDSAVVVLKNPQAYFDILAEIGVLVFDAKSSNEAEWTADIALEKMGCSLDFAKSINQCYSGLMMFDFKIDIANTIFNDFCKYSLDRDICNGTGGSVRPEFKEHRHDQSIVSYCVRKHGLYNLNFGGFIWEGFLGQWGYNSPTFVNLGIGKAIPKVD